VGSVSAAARDGPVASPLGECFFPVRCGKLLSTFFVFPWLVTAPNGGRLPRAIAFFDPLHTDASFLGQRRYPPFLSLTLF